jgi:hypothetical protein
VAPHAAEAGVGTWMQIAVSQAAQFAALHGKAIVMITVHHSYDTWFFVTAGYAVGTQLENAAAKAAWR